MSKRISVDQAYSIIDMLQSADIENQDLALEIIELNVDPKYYFMFLCFYKLGLNDKKVWQEKAPKALTLMYTLARTDDITFNTLFIYETENSITQPEYNLFNKYYLKQQNEK